MDSREGLPTLVGGTNIDCYKIKKSAWVKLTPENYNKHETQFKQAKVSDLNVLNRSSVIIKHNDDAVFLQNGAFALHDKNSGRIYYIYILAKPYSFPDILNCLFFLQSRHIHSQGERFITPPNVLTRKYYMGACSGIAYSMVHILATIGIEARVVKGWCGISPNGNDDGHTLIEFKSTNEKWYLFDSSYGLLPTLDNNPISMLELCLIIRDQIERIDSLKFIDSYFKLIRPSYFDIDKIYDSKKADYIELNNHSGNVAKFNCHENMIAWYKHVLQVPIYYDTYGVDFISQIGLSDKKVMCRFYGRRAFTTSDIMQKFY